MKNLTITVDEEVLRWAKVWAAQRDTSVSRIVGELLREKMHAQTEGYAAAKREYMRRNRAGHRRSRPRPTREELHDRQLLR